METAINVSFSLNENGTVGKDLLFSWLDFTFFGLMLAVSTIIGVYFGTCGKKQDSPKEYLHGGKTMDTLPVAVSLVASATSGITVMGVPSEVYYHGTLYWLVCISAILVGFINHFVYLPVFYELQLTSTYEYLELRFNQKVRVIASFLYTVSLLLYIPIVVYVPALAFSQVSGLNLHFITLGTSIICIFYTMIGGLKAVVWTDFLQGVVMVVASIVVIILGVIHIGGPSLVWDRNVQGGRIRLFEMSPSPLVRMSFWTVVIGNTISWTSSHAIKQAVVQKFLALPTYSHALRSLVMFVAGIVVIKCITCYVGLLIYATYFDCDLLKSKVISRADQILTYYVMDIAGKVPGLPGLFVAGIFSAALSTMSSCLNALGATLFEDFVRPCLKHRTSDKTASNIIKVVVVIIGAICLAIVFIVDKLGSILQLSMSTLGVTAGATLGIFSFGMFYPRGNSKGALAGGLCSLVFMSWIVFGAQMALADGTFRQPPLATSTEGCGGNITSYKGQMYEQEEPLNEAFILFRISFMYYSLIGTVLVFVVGIPVSLLTEPPEEGKVTPALFTPLVRKYFLPKPNAKDPVEMNLLSKTAQASVQRSPMEQMSENMM